jgi:hypothetical protein
VSLWGGGERLSKVGEIVQWEWSELPKRLRFIELGAFVVMPNHFHGILIFHEHVGATRQGLFQARSSMLPFTQLTAEGIDGSPLHNQGICYNLY